MSFEENSDFYYFLQYYLVKYYYVAWSENAEPNYNNNVWSSYLFMPRIIILHNRR